MNIKIKLGKKIKELRKARNLTQEHMSELMGIEPASLSNIENGRYYPTAENLDKILKILDVKANELYTFDYLAPSEQLVEEMVVAMNENPKLVSIMYRFFSTIKFDKF
ncbi:MAG: helix-turn-helix transcriptional regulator [Candidatus Gastranaerophilales bacterium]